MYVFRLHIYLSDQRTFVHNMKELLHLNNKKSNSLLKIGKQLDRHVTNEDTNCQQAYEKMLNLVTH